MGEGPNEFGPPHSPGRLALGFAQGLPPNVQGGIPRAVLEKSLRRCNTLTRGWVIQKFGLSQSLDLICFPARPRLFVAVLRRRAVRENLANHHVGVVCGGGVSCLEITPGSKAAVGWRHGPPGSSRRYPA